MKQNEARNLTMMMDLYELTMANGYFNDQDKDVKVAFDVFYRKNPDDFSFIRLLSYHRWSRPLFHPGSQPVVFPSEASLHSRGNLLPHW